MSRRQVLVQLDDDLVTELDRIALKSGLNRSELIRRGALALINAEQNREDDELLQLSYRAVPQDPAIVEAAMKLAVEILPPW
jgi:metal-responsive CopG/Arc/MetJ family transcriptional regulator